LIPSNLPFNFRRLQFPVSLAFAMTINKSQGQTIKVVGLNLVEPCFSNGQLYVACSRVSNPKNLFVLAPSGSTKNVVYHGALA
jgi:ATP-dependent DNA helicase PIF1